MGGYSRNDVAKAHAEEKELRAHMIRHTWNPGQLFALGFCVMCFLVYLFPLMSVWDVAFDTHVSFWFGTYAMWWTLPIPILFVAVLVYHLRLGYVRRKAVMSSIIIPCVIFFLLGASLKVKSDGLIDKITFDDCGKHDPMMQELDLAAIDAEKFLTECNPAAIRAVTLENCPDFQEWRKPRAKEWDYLQYLEYECDCSNFCHSGKKSVWTPPEGRRHVIDACSNCVLSVMRTKVQHAGMQLMGYAVIVMAALMSWVFAIKSSLDWISHSHETARGLHSDRKHHHDPAPVPPPPLRASEAVFLPAPVPPPLRVIRTRESAPVPPPVVQSIPSAPRTAGVPMPEAVIVTEADLAAPVVAREQATSRREQGNPASQHRSILHESLPVMAMEQVLLATPARQYRSI